jgi:DNA-binding CsgD family transcriptional regulator
MLAENRADRQALVALANAITAIGSDAHVEQLIDFLGALVPHDRVTVVRYSTTERPEFISHRNYSDVMVRKYLDIYYVYDPFYAYWRNKKTSGVVALRQWLEPRGPYISEFLGESVISDEIGVLLNDGPGWCLGIFLDRSTGHFSKPEFKRLQDRFSVFAAIHDRDIQSRASDFMRTGQKRTEGRTPKRLSTIQLPPSLWPELSARERQMVQLMLEGFPAASIAKKLGIAYGTVKNHRLNIYRKLDITTERELFLNYITSQPEGRIG